jgi:hypothetical protein
MNAYKCDRCGNFYVPDIREDNDDSFKITMVRIYDSGKKNAVVSENKDFDLCPRCAGSLSYWLNRTESEGV